MEVKPLPFEQVHVASIHGKKVQYVFTVVYDFEKLSSLTKPDNYLHNCNVYVMVMVKIDSNTILLKLLKRRKDLELIHRYDSLIKHLLRAGVSPKKYVLDNEISHHMKDYIKVKYHFTLKLVPPGCHCCNAAKVAIHNFKEHSLSVLAGTADSFPPSLWDCLLPQTKIMLNLLCQPNATPTISAFAHLSSLFDYKICLWLQWDTKSMCTKR
ncbi:LOW QUALITY PROTEIN: hypothetical protein ACHAW6_007144 [Cyclotella cf. meneghiniana]